MLRRSGFQRQVADSWATVIRYPAVGHADRSPNVISELDWTAIRFDVDTRIAFPPGSPAAADC
jgi:hypothetical protein